MLYALPHTFCICNMALNVVAVLAHSTRAGGLGSSFQSLGQRMGVIERLSQDSSTVSRAATHIQGRSKGSVSGV